MAALLQSCLAAGWLALLAAAPAGAQPFGPATALNANAASDSGFDAGPALATDGEGTWLAVWQSSDSLGGTIGADRDILFARSLDAGASWTGPAALNSFAAGDASDDSAPQVATDGAGTWLVVWQSDDTLGGSLGTDRDILVAVSTDAGASWSSAASVNADAASDGFSDAIPHLATDGAGSWVALWDREDMFAQLSVQFARSADTGATWSAPADLSSECSGLGDQGRVAADGAGRWVAVWRYGCAGAEIAAARSSDGGASWTAPIVLEPTPPNGLAVLPDVATDGAGRWLAVWASGDTLGGSIGSDGDVFVARSTDSGATWSTPAVLNSDADSDALDDAGARVSAGPGTWIATWERFGADFRWDVFTAESSDGGVTWSAPGELPATPTAASDDLGPVVLSDGAGRWLLAWGSSDPLGSLGADFDILVATASLAQAVPASGPRGLAGLCAVLLAGAGAFARLRSSRGGRSRPRRRGPGRSR